MLGTPKHLSKVLSPPTIRLWVTEYLATSQDLLPFIAKAVEWYGMDLTDSSLGQTQVVCVR